MSSKKKISRRKFIILLFLATGAALTAAFFITPFNNVIIKILKSDLSHLNVDDTLFEKFVTEAQQNNHWKKKFFDAKKQMFVRAYYILDSLYLPLPYKYKYRQYRSEIVGDFLLSTDFFLNKMNPEKKVTYLALYNPYKRPCSNPFSNLYYQDV